MRRSRIALAAGLQAAAAGASWLATRELDRRRVRSDPEHPRINAPLRGRALRVTADHGGLVERHLVSSSSPVTASAGSTGSDASPSSASRTSA